MVSPWWGCSVGGLEMSSPVKSGRELSPKSWDNKMQLGKRRGPNRSLPSLLLSPCLFSKSSLTSDKGAWEKTADFIQMLSSNLSDQIQCWPVAWSWRRFGVQSSIREVLLLKGKVSEREVGRGPNRSSPYPRSLLSSAARSSLITILLLQPVFGHGPEENKHNQCFVCSSELRMQLWKAGKSKMLPSLSFPF